MARAQPVIPVTSKMYRHFAVITLGITGCLAMFADGENREAIEDRLASNKQQHEMQQAEKELAKQGKGGNIASNFTDKRRNKGSFGADTGVHFDNRPVHMANTGSASFSDAQIGVGERVVLVDEGQPLGPGEMSDMPPPGMSMEEYQDMKAKGKKKKKKAANSKPSARDVEAFMAASAARSQTRGY